MNITDNLIRIKEGKDNIIKSLKKKGVSINDNTLINEIPTIIDNAEIGGGGGDTPSVPIELVQKYEGATVFRINVPEDNYLAYIGLSDTQLQYSIDWGDNTNVDENCERDTYHVYKKKGVYDINLFNLSKTTEIQNYGTNNISIFDSEYDDDLDSSNPPRISSPNKLDTTRYITDILIGNNISSIYNYAFQYCSSLQSIVIPEGVKSINGKAFQYCSSLQSIVIPEGVKSIGDSAFENCSSLQSVVIPEGVTSIGNNAFQGCSSLTSITIPEGVTTIRNSVFNGCSSLQSIVIPNSVTSISSNAFYGCSSLQSVVIPEGVKFIEQNSFYNCYSLQSVVIPNSVTSIGQQTFYNCYSLQSVNIPESVTSLGYNTFSNCYSLKSIVIPNGVKSIDQTTFNGCKSLQSVNIPESVTSLGYNAFSNCVSLSNITCKAMQAPTIQSSGTFSNIGTNVPSEITKILYVPEGAIGYDSDNWKTYVVDKGFELSNSEPTNELNDYQKEIVYTLNNNLLKVEFNSKIKYTTIYDNQTNSWKVLFNYVADFPLFVRATQLTTVIIPNGVITIPIGSFYNCIRLTDVSIPETVTTIGSSVFENCKSLSNITCKAMQAPTIQTNTFSSIGTKVPSGTPKVLRVPEGATGYDSGNWKTYVLNKGYKVEYIVPNTLNYTSYSGDIVTPYAKSFEGKNEIVSNVYENGIGTLTFKEGLTEIYDSMYNKDVVGELTSIEIPNNITRIGDYSFRSQNLTTLNVPNSVIYIGDSAFNGCTNLTEITLGSGVETIGQWAFSSCGKVSTITSMAMIAPTFNQSFLGVGSNVSGDKILRVPQGAEGYDTWLSQLNGFTIEYI